MSAGMFNSDSRTKVRISFRDDKIAAADGSVVIAPKNQTGDKGRINSASQGGVAITGKGNTVTVSSTDYGAIAAATALSDKALVSQANLAAAAIGAASDSNRILKDLAETKVTDGANLQNKTVQIGLAVMAAVVLLVMLMKK